MQTIKGLVTVVAIAGCLAMAGCDAKDKEEKQVESARETDTPKIMATVAGEPVSAAQFAAFLKLKRVSPDDASRVSAMRDEYLEREALAATITDAGLLDEEATAAELNEFRKEMLISRYFQQFLDDKGSDTEVRNYYESNPGEFQQRRAKVAHILFRTNSQMDETERSVKLTSAREVLSRLGAGEEFSDLAKSHSEDKLSSEKGGDLGWIKEGSIDPRFSEQAFSLEKGDVSDPVITPFGYHIIKLLDGPSVVSQPLESVRGDIRFRLRSQARDAELTRLKSASEIQLVNDDAN